MKALTMIFSAFFIAGVASAGEQHGGQHGKPSNSSGAFSAAGAVAGSTAISGATGGQGGTGGNSSSSGGSATATGGSVSVTTAGSGSGLTGRMVPDVSTTAPITSTSCRNGISAGGSGNGWGGLLGFFSEDDMCEWRLLEANYRQTGDYDKANAIRSGMTLQRCEKLAPKEREMFGDLCPKAPVQESQNPAFASAG